MIKDVVVHLSGSEEDEVRLTYAEAIAERFEAHLTGLYVHMMPEVVGTYLGGAVAMDELFEASNARAAETLRRLEGRFERLRLSHEVRRLDVLSGTAGQALTAEARTADIFVATRPYGDPADEVHMEVAVLFGSGRACLFVPPRGEAKSFGTVLVAWNGSREAARAVAEAMPLLKQASLVTVVREGEGAEFGGDIARHLSRHGISAVIATVDAAPDGPGQTLLNEVRRFGADLLVIGGYGHSRFLEWVLGGATRHILAHAHVPVFMAR